MDRTGALTIVRAASVVVVLAAIVAQAIVLADAGAFDASRFFAFFTIQSNLIGVAAFIWLLATRGRERSRGLDLLRGAAAVYLTVTFFVVIFLLSGVDVQLQLVWVDVVLHKIFPIVVVLDWIVDPPRTRLTARTRGPLAGLPARLDRADAGSRGRRRVVSLSVPRPGPRRVRAGRRDGRRRGRGVRRDRGGDHRDRQRPGPNALRRRNPHRAVAPGPARLLPPRHEEATRRMARSKRSRRSVGGAGIGRALSLMAFLPIASRVPMYTRLIASLVVDERMPAGRKALLAGAAGYLVLGRDLIPDDLPIIGGLDDLVVIVLAAELFLDGVPDDLLNEKLAELGIDRAEFDSDVAQVRRLTPGPVRRTIRRVPELIGGIGDALKQLGLGPRTRAWINREDSKA